MKITIFTRKFKVAGTKYRTIGRIYSWKHEELPSVYLKSYPNCYINKETQALVIEKTEESDDTIKLKRNTTLKEEEWQDIAKILKECSRRLKIIKDPFSTPTDEEEDWKEGTETFKA